MKSFLLSVVGLLFLNVAFAQHDHSLTNAKLAHDASHRLGKLVDTGKLDETFVSNLSSLEVTPLDHTDHNGPAFKVLAVAGTGVNQTALTFNMSGKYLSNKIVSKGEPEVSPWTSSAGSTLIENALHFLMEATNLESYAKGLKRVVLSQKTTADGSAQAVVKITTGTSSKVLEIDLSLSGEILGHSIVE